MFNFRNAPPRNRPSAFRPHAAGSASSRTRNEAAASPTKPMGRLSSLPPLADPNAREDDGILRFFGL